MADLATPMSIRVAATLGLVELAGSAGATAEQLASETGIATPALRRLLDHLVTISVFDRDTESDHFRPTHLGAQMSEDADGIKPLLDINSAGGRAELAFVELLGTITTGTPGYVLHDRDDDHARRILAGCRQAAAPDGTVVVIEPVRGQGADTAMEFGVGQSRSGFEKPWSVSRD